MIKVILVGLGGAIGSIFRYLVSVLALHYAADWRFPLGTFMVNIIGCLVIGTIGGLVVKHDLLTETVRLFLITGIVGGFTTFSAFGLETFDLLRRDEVLVAVSYVVSSVVVGLLVLWLGFSVVATRS